MNGKGGTRESTSFSVYKNMKYVQKASFTTYFQTKSYDI